LPDVVAPLLVATVVTSATFWWRAQFHDVWLETGGRVVFASTAIVLTAFTCVYLFRLYPAWRRG
jgi:hypothetical protein